MKRICSEVSVYSPKSPPWRRRLQRERFVEKEGFKPGVKSEGVMDDESGESIEKEVPVIGTGELESSRLVWGWRREAGNWLQRRDEAYWKERSVILSTTFSNQGSRLYGSNDREWYRHKTANIKASELTF